MAVIKRARLPVLVIVVMAFFGCRADRAPTTEKTEKGNPSASRILTTVSPAFQSPEMEKIRAMSHSATLVFGKNGEGVAYVEPYEGKARVVHNGRPGKPYVAISELIISSDGQRVAYVAARDEQTNIRVVDGREGFVFGDNDNHWFSPDGRRYYTTVSRGNDLYLAIEDSIDDRYIIERGPLFRPDSGALVFSGRPADGGDRRLVIADMDLGHETVFESCGDYILPNEAMSLLAVGCSRGVHRTIAVIDFKERRVTSEVTVDGEITRMKFPPDERVPLYTVVRPKRQRYIIWKGHETKIPDGEEFYSDPMLLSGPDGVGVIIGNVYRAWFHRTSGKDEEREPEYGYISNLVVSRDGRHHAYIGTRRDANRMQIVVDGQEGPAFDKIVSPVFSPDNRVLVYRARQDGRRFVVVSDFKGKTIRRLPDHDMVFQPEFVDGGALMAYVVLDGRELRRQVEKP